MFIQACIGRQFVCTWLVGWCLQESSWKFCVLADLTGVAGQLSLGGWVAERLPEQLASWLAGYRSNVCWANCEWEHLMWVTGQWWAHLRVHCVCVCDCVYVHLTSLCTCVAVGQWSQSICRAGSFSLSFNSTVWSWKRCCSDQLTLLDMPSLSLSLSHCVIWSAIEGGVWCGGWTLQPRLSDWTERKNSRDAGCVCVCVCTTGMWVLPTEKEPGVLIWPLPGWPFTPQDKLFVSTEPKPMGEHACGCLWVCVCAFAYVCVSVY